MTDSTRRPTDPAAAARDRLELARRLALQKKRAAEGSIVPRGGSGDAPLSFAQERLWFVHQLDPTSPAYNVAALIPISDEHDAGAVEGAIQRLTVRHPALRTVFPAVDGVPVQRVLPAVAVPFETHDFLELDLDDRVAALDRIYKDLSNRPFDLESGPIIRAALIAVERTYQYLALVIHHIAVDGWSIHILTRDLAALLASPGQEPSAGSNRPPIDYVDYAVWQRNRFARGDFEEAVEYWDRTLAGATALRLATDRLRPAQPSAHGARESVVVPTAIASGLAATARNERATPFMVGLAAFNLMLARWTGQRDIVVGIPVANRDRPELTDVVGFFVNMIVARTDLTGAATGREVLQRTQATARQALAHQEMPFEKVVARLRGDRDPIRNPLFQVTFATEVAHQALTQPRLDTAAQSVADVTVRFDLEVSLGIRGDLVEAAINYRTELFDQATIRRLLEAFVAAMGDLAADLDRPLPVNAPPESSMSTADFLRHLRGLDVKLGLENDRLKVNAPPGVLTDARKAELSRRKDEVMALMRAAATTRHQPLTPISRSGALPMSVPQRRLWFLDRLAPGSATYTIAGARRFPVDIDVDAFSRAIDEIVRRHESLRTIFPASDGDPRVVITPPAGPVLQQVDLRAVPEAERAAVAAKLAADVARLPFDLARGPLFRAALIRLGPADFVFAFAMHHIISDGWSMVLLGRELGVLYSAFAAGQPSPLPELTIQYVDYAQWQTEHLAGAEISTQERYWLEQLGGRLPVLQLPSDRPRPPIQSFRGARLRTELPADLIDALKEIGRAEGASLYMMLLAAFYTLLHRYTGDEDLIVGSPVANRSRVDIEPLIGFFVNTLVLRVQAEPTLTFRQLLGRVRQTLLKAQANQDVPFDRLVEVLKPARDTGHSPLFQVVFNSPSAPVETSGGGDLDFELGTARYDLTVEFQEERATSADEGTAAWRSAGLRMFWEFASDLFDPDTIRRMQGHYHQLLRDIAGNPDAPIATARLLTDPERGRLTSGEAPTPVDHDRTDRLVDLLARQADATPDAIAVVHREAQVTYRELHARANRLARELQRMGVGPDRLVGVCLERSVDMVVAVLAVLKAGGAYVPLDPSFPADRLRFMASDAKLIALITTDPLRHLVGALEGAVLCLDRDASRLAELDTTPPPSQATAGSLAYVIYTSGSTGRPKGVAIEHRSVVNFLRAMIREPGLRDTDRLLSVTTLSFDIAGLELYLPLVTGARVVLADRAVATDPSQLLELLESSGATVMQATPATWRLLIEGGWQGTAGLTVLCGGESLPRELAEQLLTRAAAVWNMYGPTETTIWSMMHRVTSGQGAVPIGRPIANTTAYLLDRNQQPVPPLVPGELFLGGEGLARGYLDRPELTAERFVADPFGAAGQRLYRTGDLVRLRSDGTYEWLGRGDGQTKIRGFRVELGEIETALAELPGIRVAAVTVHEPRPGDQRLAAFLVPNRGAQPSAPDLATALRRRLPEYMVPSSFTLVEALPLTPNGKIDRRALPTPAGLDGAPEGATWLPPGTATERMIASVWSDVLGTARIGLHDNFFDRGGHSLLVVRVHARLEKMLPHAPSLVELFQYPTIASLADRIDRGGTDGTLADATARAQRQRDA